MAPSINPETCRQSNHTRTARITPIIKIVHVHAPKLVCTDVANFRALVQEMTGHVSSLHHNNSGSISTELDTPISITQTEASDDTDHCINQVNACRATRPQRRATRCRKSATSNLHRVRAASTSSSTAPRAKEVKRVDGRTGDEDEDDDDQGDDDDGVCESSVTSWDQSSCESTRGASEYLKTSVDGFFADHEPPADTFGYSNCSAYLPLGWRPAHEVPGGFDYFSF